MRLSGFGLVGLVVAIIGIPMVAAVTHAQAPPPTSLWADGAYVTPNAPPGTICVDTGELNAGVYLVGSTTTATGGVFEFRRVTSAGVIAQRTYTAGLGFATTEPVPVGQGDHLVIATVQVPNGASCSLYLLGH